MANIKTPPRKVLLKRSLGIVLTLATILLVLHLWFVHNARTVLKQYISEQSGGKIKLELSELQLNLLAKRLQIQEADLLSTDSLNESVTYHVTFSKLSLKVSSIWALLFQRKLLLDSIKLYDPVIQVMHWRKDTTKVVTGHELSIPQEMGKFYNSMLNALIEFSVQRIVIDNAKVSLINKMKPGSEPVTISNIFFDLARSQVPKNTENIYEVNNHTVELRTSNQNIIMPGGRHRLSFKSFRLQLLRERIELDSCTIIAMATESSKSNYKIFFKKLSLSGVDFGALSSQNIIKADTVYCNNPVFDINIYRTNANKKKTEIPDANKIIRELTGNLNLAYVEVKNAGIHFDIYGKMKRSFFNSNKDNFEMHDFRINPDSLHPVSIRRFDMTLRDYRLYNEDSSSTYSFDSLHLLNSKIILSNFAILSTSGRNKIRSKVDIAIPYFELTQLDWYQLIFDQNMVAQSALLNNPVINFTRRNTGRIGKKLNLFDALQNIDSLVALENISVKNGQVNMKLGPATSFNIQNLDFKIRSNRLLRSTTKEGLQRAVEHLSFSKGVLSLKDITARLQNARFTNNNIIYAYKVNISGNSDKIVATVNDVYIDNMQLDDNAEKIEVDGLGWESAFVALKKLPNGKEGRNSGSSIELKNIEGKKTHLNFFGGQTVVSTFVQTLNASSIVKKQNDVVHVEGFKITGNNLLVNSKTAKVSAEVYNLSADGNSTLTGVRVEQMKGKDSLQMHASQVNFTTNLNDIFANDLHLTSVFATTPVIKLSKWDTDRNENVMVMDSAVNNQPPIRIDKLTATEPDIKISTHRLNSVSIVNIPRSESSIVEAADIVITNDGLQLGTLRVNTTSATFKKLSGEILGVDDGKINMALSNLHFEKNNGKINWSGIVNNLSLENANGLSMGKSKNNLHFQKISLGNLHLSSAFMPDFGQLMKINLAAWLRIPQGQFIDSNTTFKWYNANYTNSSRTLNLDSFVYHPTISLDSVLAHAPFQLDYITLKTGAVCISGLDVAQYERDSSFIANTIKINNPVLTVYRDKLPPKSTHKKDKPLPVNILKNISIPVFTDSLLMDNGTITYSEKSGKTRKEGVLLLSNVYAALTNIKNSNITDEDSLSLTFNGSLMDSAQIALSLKESYADSLSGFLLKAKISTADLSILNPVLVPISNVKIVSGILDSVNFWAIGREDIAFGEMDMHYHKLRIKLVKDGDPNQSTFMQNVISFLANTFIIRSNNSTRSGKIFYDRSNAQSFVNYVVKTILSGVITSVGARKNRRYIKQYHRHLKENNLPGIE